MIGVNDFENPFVLAQTDPFFDAYIEVLEALANVGLFYEFKQRLPIFRIFNDLQKLEMTDDVEHAIQMVDVLKELMIRGFEPEHVNGYYV